MEIFLIRRLMFGGKKDTGTLPPVVVQRNTSALERLREASIKELTQSRYTVGVFVTVRTVCPAAKAVETFTVVVDSQGSYALLDLGCFIPSARMTPDVGAWLPEGTELAIINPYIKGNFRKDPCVANIFCNLLECVVVLSYPASPNPEVKGKGKAGTAQTASSSQLKGKEKEKESDMRDQELAKEKKERETQAILDLHTANVRVSGVRGLFLQGDPVGATQLLLYRGNIPPSLRPEERQLLREIESTTGYFDYFFMLQEVPSMNLWDGLDHGNYTGPIRVEAASPTGSRMVATRDLQPGTLLLAHKAVSYTNGDDIVEQADALVGRDMSAFIHFLSLTTRAAKLMRKALQDPTASPRISKISSGTTVVATSRCEPINEEIGLYLRNNSHSMGQQLGPDLLSYAQGVWGNELTRLRHRCMLNTCAFSIGDFIFLHTVKGVPKDAELTIRFGVCGWLRERELIASRYKFTCTCPLCEEDRSLTTELRARMVDFYYQFEALKEINAPSHQFEQLLCRLQDPKLRAYKTQEYFPELGEVAYEALKQRCSENRFCNIDQLFGIALKNSSYGPESLRCFLVISMHLVSMGQRDLGEHLKKKTLRYATRIYGPNLCELFALSMKMKQ